MVKRSSIILQVIFWISPIFYWAVWQIIQANPELLWTLAPASFVLLIPVAYEAAAETRSWRFFYILLGLVLTIVSFFLFISFLPGAWKAEILWLLMIAFLYRYLWSARKASRGGPPEDWMLVSLYGGLLTVFLAASSLFALQSFLSISPWLLLASFIPFVVAITRLIAYSQGWNRKQDKWVWPLISILPLEIAMAFSLLPLNYLIAGILCTLAYYSMLNFLRLYMNGGLTRRKIKNYAWFTAVSLIIILLTARWL
ncbi:MAG: hypothetical protein ACM3PZ_01925 [Bacillota bacterium]